MKRRTLLVGCSGTVIAGASVLGTAAFSTAEVDGRSLDVHVAGDRHGWLALRPADDGTLPNSIYVEYDDTDRLRLVFDDRGNELGGDGPNVDAAFTFGRLFEAVNFGPEAIRLWGGLSSATGFDGHLYYDDESTDVSKPDNARRLEPGAAQTFGVSLRTERERGRFQGEMTIRGERADGKPPCEASDGPADPEKRTPKPADRDRHRRTDDDCTD
ncbi:hypothetical protein [Natronobiforma cellulositropha]|uniref:hypothetical protein n=1 Tax=Natronobiforma cellulositropha TaxID=1679076 RepID=UPI0021D5A2A7|nr:hypothetical protein [Natronobiforma cellulositropha]